MACTHIPYLIKALGFLVSLVLLVISLHYESCKDNRFFTGVVLLLNEVYLHEVRVFS